MPKKTQNISENPEKALDGGDALSSILGRLKLRAEVFLNADFCGPWAVDTSGKRKVPFHLISRGSGWLRTGDAEPRLLTAGDFVVLPHDDQHTISSNPSPPLPGVVNQPPSKELEGPVTSLLCGYFEFQSKAVWPLLDSLPNVSVLDLKESGRLSGTHTLMQLVISELEQNRPGVEAAVNQLAYVLFIHVIRAEMMHGLEGGLLGALTDQKIGHALNLIHANPSHGWTINRLAEQCLMSRSSFADRFKQLVGMPPIRYVTEWRMQEALELLQTTDLSVSTIAERSGYVSEVAFRKAFRSVIGEPPGRIRRAARSTNLT